MLKTYALKLRSDIRISGVDFRANEQIAAITCEINPHDLLGLVQHRHAELTEVTDDSESISPDDGELDSDSLEVENESPSPLVEEPEAAEVESEPEQPAESAAEESSSPEPTAAQSIALFVADGLEEKIAHSLVVANGIASPDALRSMMSDADFDLIDLHEIGDVRAKKIMAVYLK